MIQCKEQQFLKDISDHTMEIKRDNGTDRHISFTNNGSSFYRFDLITWPGHLCIAGDCGTYVFSRIADMFEFFRGRDGWNDPKGENTLFINPGYWGEKLQSIGTNAGYKEFDEDAFKAQVTEHFDRFFEDSDDELEEHKKDCWAKIENDVLCYGSDEHRAYNAAYEFVFNLPDEYNDFSFEDFFDGGGTERYTDRYLWCLYAIAYGVKEYDKHQAQKAA